jgi:hypothetical protein
MFQFIKKINKPKFLVLCLIFFTGYSIQAQNLARNGTATQSSTLASFFASNAIDGNLAGTNFSHTGNSSTAESNLNYTTNTIFNSLSNINNSIAS